MPGIIDTKDVAPVKRHCIMYRDVKHYFNVGQGELFISSFRMKDEITEAGMEGMARMTALAMRHAPVEQVLDQLAKSSLRETDLPGILHTIIKDNVPLWPVKPTQGDYEHDG